MAEPTLKDVLDAIAALREETKSDLAKVDAEVDGLRGDVAAHRKETKSDLAKVDAEVDALRGDVAAHRKETKSDLAKVDAKIDALRGDVAAHRAETAASFAALEKELEGHADPIHKDLEADIVAIHKGLVRAKDARHPQGSPFAGSRQGRATEQAGRSPRSASSHVLTASRAA